MGFNLDEINSGFILEYIFNVCKCAVESVTLVTSWNPTNNTPEYFKTVPNATCNRLKICNLAGAARMITTAAAPLSVSE